MKMITRVSVAIACLIAALACYAFGVPAGGVAFVLLGMVFEAMFWLRLFGSRKRGGVTSKS